MQEKMSKACNISIINIIAKSFMLFIKHFKYFFNFLAYPILGQILALLIIFVPAVVVQNTQNSSLLPMVLVCFIIGICLFIHTFWKFFVASAALNIAARDIILGKAPLESSFYMENISKRAGKYILLMFILTLISIIPIIFYIPALINAVQCLAAKNLEGFLLSLIYIFLVSLFVFIFYSPFFMYSSISFSLEKKLSPIENIKRSIMLVSNYFIKSIAFLVLYLIAYVIISTVSGILISVIFVLISHIFNFDIRICRIISSTLPVFIMPFAKIMLTWWFLKLIYKNQECLR